MVLGLNQYSATSPILVFKGGHSTCGCTESHKLQDRNESPRHGSADAFRERWRWKLLQRHRFGHGDLLLELTIELAREFVVKARKVDLDIKEKTQRQLNGEFQKKFAMSKAVTLEQLQ